MVAIASVFDFHQIANQIETLGAMRTCKIKYDSLDVDSMFRSLRMHSKLNHPDKTTDNDIICSSEETNSIRDGLRKSGTSRLAWLFHKMGVAPRHAESALMVGIGILGVCAMRGLGRVRLPVNVKRLLIFLGLVQQGAGAPVSAERQLAKRLKHSEFVYGKPPCARHCGNVPSQCTVSGWVYKD